MRRLILGACWGSALLWAAPATAEPRACTEHLLYEEARRARTWRYTWSGVHGALTVGSFVAAPLVKAEERPDFIVGGIGSAVNLAATWFIPLRVESAAEELAALPPAARARQLRQLMIESADDEQSRITWPWHLLNFGLSAIPGAIIAFGYGHYESGIVTTVAGTAIGSIQIFTQPTGLPRRCGAAAFTLTPRLSVLRAPGDSPSGAALWLVGTF